MTYADGPIARSLTEPLESAELRADRDRMRETSNGAILNKGVQS